MKILVLACMLLGGAVPAFAQAPPSNTANYFIAKPEAWMDKPVSVSVAWIDVPTTDALVDGYRQMRGETINSNIWGGYITILAKPDAATRIIKLCGTQHYKTQIGVVPHTINGTFTKMGDKYVIKVEK